MIEFRNKDGEVTLTITDQGIVSTPGTISPATKLNVNRVWTNTDIDNLSVLAGFDPTHKIELGMVRSVVRSILRGEQK